MQTTLKAPILQNKSLYMWSNGVKGAKEVIREQGIRVERTLEGAIDGWVYFLTDSI